MYRLMFAVLAFLTTLYTATALSEPTQDAAATQKKEDAQAAPQGEVQTDQAVVEYLKLRKAGKRHWEALSMVRAKYSITDKQLEEAANRISTNGYPETVKADVSERAPGSSAPAKPN